MGIPWGIVAYPATYERERLVAEWRPLVASMPRRFSMLHGDERLDVRRRAEKDPSGGRVVSVDAAPAADLRAQVDALSTGDGTHDWFEQLFDGFELFVPWTTGSATVHAPGSPRHGKRCASVDELVVSMRQKLELFRAEPPRTPEVARLAAELLTASKLAKKHRMFIEVSF